MLLQNVSILLALALRSFDPNSLTETLAHQFPDSDDLGDLAFEVKHWGLCKPARCVCITGITGVESPNKAVQKCPLGRTECCEQQLYWDSERGLQWHQGFRKYACNVVRAAGSSRNGLSSCGSVLHCVKGRGIGASIEVEHGCSRKHRICDEQSLCCWNYDFQVWETGVKHVGERFCDVPVISGQSQKSPDGKSAVNVRCVGVRNDSTFVLQMDRGKGFDESKCGACENDVISEN